MNAKQQKFILLRADGISFDKIAKDLKVSKPTLIQWSKLFEEDIKDIQFQNFINIKESYSWNTQKRYKDLLEQMELVNGGISKADLTQASLKDLFTIKNSIVNQIEMIEKRVKTDPKISSTNELGYKEQLILNLYEID